MHNFKEGDWVRELDPLPGDNAVYQLTHSDFYGVGTKCSKYFEGIEHWKPIKDEYVINLRYGLCRVERYREDNNSEILVYPIALAIDGYQYIKVSFCQPFIGKVPTF